jgi:AraC-like DNA-binding protein
MASAEFREMIPAVWPQMAVEDWTSQLREICGSFQPRPCVDVGLVTGGVAITNACGLELAQIANNLDVIRRERSDIRSDYGENLFLLLQLQGHCGIEQFGGETVIASGDCILVDSSRPSVFHFRGQFSNHLSVHLPRQLLFADKSTRVGISRRLGPDDPMSAMLRALVAKLLLTDASHRRAADLRHLLFETTRQAFAVDEGGDASALSDSAAQRLETALILIDRNLTEPCLTPQWLANQIGISLRTLQEDFAQIGETPTSLIRTRRLHLAREQLEQMRSDPRASTIAEIAYASGFNDISYFNRCFRKAFDCSPKDMLQH